MGVEGGLRWQGRDEDAVAALRRSAVALRPGWVLLTGDALRRDAAWAEDVEAVLIHAEVGVALFGPEPSPGAAGKLRQALDAAGFSGAFGGHPPVVYRVLPPPGLPLQEVLDQAFEMEPALSLSEPEGWTWAAQNALAAKGAEAPREAPPLTEGAETLPPQTPASVAPLGTANRVPEPHRRFPPLLVVGVVLATLGGVALALYFGGLLGTGPARPPTNADAAASTPMNADTLLPAVVMGVVEGLTEFLPISSTGHLILLGEVIGFRGPPGKVFEISIQFGAVLAVVWLLRDVLWRIATRGWVPGTPAHRYARTTLLAFVPAMALGATLHKPITERLFSPSVVAIALILGGVALIAIERWRPAPRIRSVLEIGAVPALLIGFGQALALVPGTSRSGATILLALLIGVERRTAVEFSFMLAIPTMLAATAYSLWQNRAVLDGSALGQIAVGFAVSFAVALVVVRWMLAAIGRIGFAPFGWYRIALGMVILAWTALR